ncbi:large ribosomal subunit protein mL63 [Petromyzon marinus]|uniref:Mitochondrial ribosomal protein L57 n=1 Tax=Petromyzon marinus TaxID=7757 RepID=S4S0F6_PETMA|nr:ribosomal protein 63, mitochondrial [Petromyzon marinus]XP_032803662.1 ribosomal protein 63, mitochondrial [Petromyzon marinus]XP_032803663.1 ribosomal protein 63, mitochondrial [Petromyzon marinus]XP_032803664.1 ribosomal protein 63, mitochondrial [Petromyzon marinus]XP_032803665.1 ribosomal protein 63, mitochondrial [Petromyzon marinus]XP_032803666.1 ribosomal protein 63, mitochondrial [Petromyzon marinus]XP_032803668.1 ribosomal protein 63, mitochondrial [Petromyzon marinus]XP_03280366
MFLSALLRMSLPGGRQWAGKHRRPLRVSYNSLVKLRRRLEAEAENEYWLSRAWMSREQESGHMVEFRTSAFRAFTREKTAARFPPHRFVNEHLQQLNVNRRW